MEPVFSNEALHILQNRHLFAPMKPTLCHYWQLDEHYTGIGQIIFSG